MIGIPLVLLLAAGGAVAAIEIHHNNQVAAQHQAAVRAAARRAAAARRLAAAKQREKQALQTQQNLQNQLANIQRQALVDSLQSSVKTTAEKDVNQGLLNGPILSASCEPATTADATATIANYTCLAVNSVSGGQSSGYRFSATINTTTGQYTWRLGG